MQINIQRQIAMLEKIPTHPRRITANDITARLQSRDFDIGLRTVQRELKAMYDMGLFGIVLDDRSKPFGWSIAACWRGLNLTLMDNHMALAFHTLKHSASQLLPPQSLKQLTPYFERADQILGNDPDNPWLYWACRVAQLPKPFPLIIEQQDPQIFEAVQSALLNKRQIACEIKRPIEGKSYWIDYSPINPEGIKISDGVALLTFTIGTVDPRIYAKSIDLLRNVRLLDTPAITRSDAELAARKNNHKSELIDIELLFSASANFIMRNAKLSDNQTVEQLQDKRYLVKASVKDTSGLRSLLWSMADNVEVLAPAKLRAHFTRLINKVNARYQNAAS
ncbi:YafY family protein [Shewanella sp. UCD-KL21]|uniref:helix-turn-helix transcriptional regulator n=1 Tax=Shewanella sp. UCD-KL21 TaxID=1917164 RepID=UPI000970FC1D|nr:WYL domain-containing transcriptional regulator [Shewanella sp. UCD-KL21]